MKIYWSLKNVPELAPLSASERRVVNRTCFSRHGYGWRRLVEWLVLACCAGAVIGDSLPFLNPILAVGIGGALGGFISSQMLIERFRPHYAEFIKHELREHGV